MKTGEGLARWAENAVNTGKFVYWYGTYCNPCNMNLLNGKQKQYPKHYTTARRATYEKHIAQGKICTDCVGLIKGYYWEKAGEVKYKRDGLPDVSAKGMYNACRSKGVIMDEIPEIRGLLVFNDDLSHVGVYIGNGKVAEAQSFAKGVRINNLSARTFTLWGLCPYIQYEQDNLPEKGTEVEHVPTIRSGSEGLAVQILQRLLIAHRYTLPKYGVDGDYGNETISAVKQFQAENGLTVDGVCGPKTWAALTTI